MWNPYRLEEEVEPAQGVFHITCSPNIKGDNNSSCVAVAATHWIIWRSHPPAVAAAPHPPPAPNMMQKHGHIHTLTFLYAQT